MSQTVRWMPNGIGGRRPSSRMAFDATGQGVIRLHEPAMPRSIDSITAASIANSSLDCGDGVTVAGFDGTTGHARSLNPGPELGVRDFLLRAL